MAVFVRWVFAVWKLVGTVGKQSRMMIWACFYVPARSAFWYSTTAEMYKGHTFYFWLRTAAAIWRMGPPFKSWCILNDQVSTHLPCLVRCQKKELLARCGVHSEWPHGVWCLPFNRCDGIYISSLIRQWRKTSSYCKGSCFFLPVALPNRYCQYWAMRYSSFGFWTNPCNRLVRYLLIRASEISAQPPCIKIKIPLGLHFNRSINYLLKHIFKYPRMNESVALKHYIR